MNIEQKQDNIKSNSKEISKIFKKLSRDVIIHILLLSGKIRVKNNKIIFIITEDDDRYHMLDGLYTYINQNCSYLRSWGRGRQNTIRISISIPFDAENEKLRYFQHQKLLFYEDTPQINFKKMKHGKIRTLTRDSPKVYDSSDSGNCSELYSDCDIDSFHDSYL